MTINLQKYYKNLVVQAPQNFKIMFDQFSSSCMKGLICQICSKFVIRIVERLIQ